MRRKGANECAPALAPATFPRSWLLLRGPASSALRGASPASPFISACSEPADQSGGVPGHGMARRNCHGAVKGVYTRCAVAKDVAKTSAISRSERYSDPVQCRRAPSLMPWNDNDVVVLRLTTQPGESEIPGQKEGHAVPPRGLAASRKQQHTRCTGRGWTHARHASRAPHTEL